MTWLSRVHPFPLSLHPFSHLHEGTEERVAVLLLPGISHGLLHSQAVPDIGLEPLSELEGHIEGQGAGRGRRS